MKKTMFFCWMVVASALLVLSSCSKDQELLNGELNGGNGGNENEDSTAFFKRVEWLACKTIGISWTADNAVVTRAAEQEATKDASVIATINHQVNVQKWFSTDSETKPKDQDTLWMPYTGTITTKFFGLIRERRAGSMVFAKDPVITNYEGTINLNWSGRKVALVVEDEVIPAYLNVVEKDDTIHFTKLCKVNTISIQYVGFDTLRTQENAEYWGYQVTLKFKHEIEGGNVADYAVQTYLWVAKNGVDPEDPEDDREVIKIEEISATNMRDTSRDETNLMSHVYWSRQLKYFFNDGTDTIVNTQDTTLATLGIYPQELNDVFVGNINDYMATLTMHARGGIVGNRKTITVGINDEEKTLTSEWTVNVHKVGNVERPLKNDAYYFDFSWDKEGSSLEQINDSVYAHHCKMVTKFTDNKLPQVFFWNRKVTVRDMLMYREIIQKWISHNDTTFFLNLKVNAHYSGSGDHPYTSNINLGLKLRNNGPITIFEALKDITTTGTERKVLSTIKNDSLSGSRTQTTVNFDVNGKNATLIAELDEIARYFDKEATSGQLEVSYKSVEKVSESVEGIYDVINYDMIVEVKLDNQIIETSIRIVQKLLNLKPTMPGYRFFKGGVTRVYNGDRSKNMVAITAVWQNIVNPNIYAVTAYDKAKNDAAIATGKGVQEAMDESKIELVNWEKVSLANLSQYPSLVYNKANSRWDNPNVAFCEPADMAGLPGTNFQATNGWHSGWEYVAFSNVGHAFTFSPLSVNTTTYPNPWIGNITSFGEGIFNFGNIYLISDK